MKNLPGGRAARNSVRMLLLGCATLLVATGCHKKTPLPPVATAPDANYGPAPTATLSADPTVVDLGGSVVLNWRTTNATSVEIDGIGQVPVNGTQTVSPANSTNFHLVAKGDGGTTEASVRVTVRVPVTPTDNGNANANADNGTVSDAAFHAAVPDVFFDYDSSAIRADAQSSIQAAATYLQQHPSVRILIGGYCDDRGSAEYNITLGEERANAAKNALVTDGVSGSRIRVISYGKERQFCTEETESCWQQNRRAQFSIDR